MISSPGCTPCQTTAYFCPKRWFCADLQIRPE
ncbi:unnamed protein product [Gulo gulo]|uniref:Uncharacterized protein n=1 Tax=Gulo gulo TaxID=48420 RepID=A0A9X9LZR6_GULGU|nr:unnamed protein product [Gulo gulo]